MSTSDNGLDTFFVEALELIQLFEETLLSIDTEHIFPEIINTLFRTIHTLKGSGSLFGLDVLVRFCHVVENTLDLSRKGQWDFNQDRVNILLKCADHVRLIIQASFEHGQVPSFIIDDGLELLTHLGTLEQTKELSQNTDIEWVEDTPVIEIDEKLIADFLLDASEQLEVIDSGLLSLENNPDDFLILDAVFRGFHTLKSGAGIMSFLEIEKVAHILEGILSDIRERQISFPLDKNFLCIEGATLIRKMIIEVQNKNHQELFNYHNEIDSLFFKINGKTEIAPVVQVTQVVLSSSETIEHNVPKKMSTLREGFKVDADKLDKLIDIIGELVISQTLVSQSPDLKIFNSSYTIIKDLDRLSKITRNLQEIGMSLRMIPIRQTFKKMNRLVHDLSKKLDKEINFIMSGEETELDKAVADKIGDPLVHMLRNSLDHGIEKKGTITLRAYHRGGSVCIEIKDDGRGLNPEKLLAKARENGIIGKDEKLSLSETYALIFRAGFSTAAQVTDVSGRGVGMDVVKRNIEDIHGQIEIESEVGKGTTFTVRIPNTLAIIEGMIIVVGRERYVIPTYSIVRSINPTGKEIITSGGKRTEMFNLDGEILPLLRLGSIYNIRDAETDPCQAIVLILEESGKKLAILVDEIIRQQQFVVKPLTGIMSNIPGVSGGTVMPDGQVGLILDTALLIQHIKEKHTHLKQGEYRSGQQQ